MSEATLVTADETFTAENSEIVHLMDMDRPQSPHAPVETHNDVEHHSDLHGNSAQNSQRSAEHRRALNGYQFMTASVQLERDLDIELGNIALERDATPMAERERLTGGMQSAFDEIVERRARSSRYPWWVPIWLRWTFQAMHLTGECQGFRIIKPEWWGWANDADARARRHEEILEKYRRKREALKIMFFLDPKETRTPEAVARDQPLGQEYLTTNEDGYSRLV
ncbi:hypothetical protein B0T19DRAFT_442071 [Cercophora scortea]|uniref:Uncharacterized protein n=1 Tax=Cercophora scortea TaxID=314031 RepID=A0AAE0MD44_9PEZI|nr:hypothetical protein B0T19DRAFT_442071 [Cercophora scortea]